MNLEKATANKIHRDIDAIEKLLNDEILSWTNDKDRMKKLTCWDYITTQLNI